MALRVWLPLNGSVENKGISDTAMSGSPAYWGNGKIGKCATFTGNVGNVIYNNTTDYNYTDKFSWTIWINTNYTGTTAQYAFTNGRADAGGYGYGLQCSNTTTCNIRFGNQGYGVAVTGGEWTHLAFTKSGTSIKIYKNGSIVTDTTFTGTLPTYSDGNGLGLGCFHYSGNIYPFYGSLNDFRIYDHVLSAKEVKEISQGLVLHYKLDQLSQGSGHNLVTGLTSGGQTTVVNDTIVTSGQNSDTYFRINLSSALTLNKSYTMGIDAENLPDGGYFRFPIGSQNNSSAGYIDIYNGHNEAVFIANDVIVNCGTLLMMDDNARTAWPNQCIFKNFYIYENTSVTDSSGYENDGTITGTLSTESDSNRYEISTHYSGSSYTDTGSGTFNWFDFSQCTLSAWIKSTASVSGWSGSIGIQHNQNAGHKGFTITDYANNFRVVTVNGSYTTIDSGKPLTVGEWHYCVAVLNGTNLKMYYDGSMVKESTVSWGSAAIATDMRFATGVDFPGSDEMFTGNYSDVRMYCTALSAEDILDLYHTSANIDDLGNLHGFEFVEDNENKISKNGIINNNIFSSSIINNFTQTRSTQGWTLGGNLDTNGHAILVGTAPTISSDTFYVDNDDIYEINFNINMTSPSSSGDGLHLGITSSTNTIRCVYNWSSGTYTETDNASSSWNTYFVGGFKLTRDIHIKTYVVGANVNINTIKPEATDNAVTVSVIKIKSPMSVGFRAGYNTNTTMTLEFWDPSVIKINDHIKASIKSIETVANDFIEK